ncbi:MAG: hypothetical protein KME16_00200 [Scytolyngbya sp. HA4215-MV1]|jgi:hypothetical protein|nr:hypothetical protein [Scytolyngbya sp. HA4215-MV1]
MGKVKAAKEWKLNPMELGKGVALGKNPGKGCRIDLPNAARPYCQMVGLNLIRNPKPEN